MNSYPASKVLASFYSLLRLALGTTSILPQELEDLTHFGGKEWSGLLALSRQQAVVGLVYEGLSKLSPEVLKSMPGSIGSAFILETDRIVRGNEVVLSVADTIRKVIEDNRLSATIMKGPVVGAFYPAPKHRTPGDIDVYCHAKHYELFMKLISSLSEEKLHRAPDGSWHHKIQGIDIDIHPHYFDFEIPGQMFPPVPSPYATLLMLSSHILKHAMGPGVGLRQICDMAMAYRFLQGQYDLTQLRTLYKTHGLLRWNILLSDFIALRLGFNTELSEKAPSDISTLEKIVLRGGNFGHYKASRSKVLSGSDGRRKADTLVQFASHLPFALQYAPRQLIFYLKSLAKGNLPFRP